MPDPSTPCRYCGATERYSKEVPAAGPDGFNLLPLGMLNDRKFRIEVCGICGHVEWFVPERFLASVRSRFDRLP